MSEKMHSQELGLVLAQQLLQVEDLHYGLWRKELDLNLANVPQAQQEYTDMILSDLPPTPAGSPVRVIDIGCGTGHILAQMVDKGYQVDGVIPAPHLANKVRERIAARPGCKSQVYENTLEDLPESVCNGQYDVALFSESYQYIPLDQSFNKLKQLLKPGGLVIICDFFATEHTGDGKQGDGSFGGGHAMKYFYEVVEREPFTLEKDIDITELVSPNLQLVNNLLMDKLGPAGQ
ncbi:MAG: class I SAM-dependent methyltransferase, partial [Gammaproteobacteria bacterium]|nr:class I SAM-dependent methyltransferase [Gammaproteobacteria bacterium]